MLRRPLCKFDAVVIAVLAGSISMLLGTKLLIPHLEYLVHPWMTYEQLIWLDIYVGAFWVCCFLAAYAPTYNFLTARSQ